MKTCDDSTSRLRQGSRRTELPFRMKPGDIYRRIAHLGEAVLLDSGDSERGRWDVLAAAPDPDAGLQLGAEVAAEALHRALAAFHAESERRCPSDGAAAADDTAVTADRPPFTGGYIGHFSYELGRRLQGLTPRPMNTPLASVRFYPWCIVQDRLHRRSWLLGDYDNALAREILACLDSDDPTPDPPGPGERFALNAAFRPAWSLERYREVFARVQDYIAAGDCYQINIGQPFRAAYDGDLLSAYEALRPVARAPYSAFLPIGGASTLLSLSPERFLTVRGREVETRPIKGTRPRGDTGERDRAAAEALLASEKERAENLMIVDLLRNDIGRFCRPGSVRVEALFELESYATVHHLVSSVRGTLAADVTPLQLLLGCLPGGSITGAPKRRAMEIIDQLEPAARQAWCGTIFYLSRDGQLDSNIAIRTLFNAGQELLCWAGGGLVADSRAGREYAEQYDKVGAFLECLGALGACGEINTPAARGF